MSSLPFRPAAIAIGVLVGGLAVGSLGVPAAYAQSLAGAWSGGGQIVFPSGEKERARCRASFRRQGRNSYAMSAVCATASARVEQSARIEQVGGNVFRGSFYNEEHGISGSIRIAVRGSRLHASLAGGGGSAVFSLSRR